MTNGEMKKCKFCGTDMPRKGVFCPKCGGKNDEPIYKKVWFIVTACVLSVLVLLFVIGCLSDDSDTVAKEITNNRAQAEQNAKKYEYVEIEQLMNALKTNAARAQNEYKGKYVQIVGVLSSIDSDGSYFNLETPNDVELLVASITCFIKSDDHRKIIINCNKGEEITVWGKITDVGETLGYSIEVEDVFNGVPDI